MGLFERDDSPFWHMLLEGTGRKKESTGIRRDASSAKIRKANRAQAEEIYHARMTQLARERVGLPIESNETFLAFSKWYEEHHINKHGAKARELVIVAKLRDHFGAMRLADVRPGRWKEYETKRLEDGVSITTIGRELALMKGILNAAVGEHLEVNPLANVKRKSPKQPAKRTLTKADEQRLLEQLHDDELRDLYLVGVGTLLRQMNLVMLQRKHHRGDRLVVETKTGPHQVSLVEPTILQRRAAMTLKRRLPKTHDGYFFPKWQARFARDRNGANAKFLQSFRRACRRADVPWGLKNQGVVWHTATRASGATRLLREHGVDIRTVQLIGGWRSLDQMAEYLGVDLSRGSLPTIVASGNRAGTKVGK